MYLNGHGIAGRDARGNPITDDHFLLFFNVGDEIELTLPSVGVRRARGTWSSTPAASPTTGGPTPRATRSTCSTARWWCSASTTSPRRSPTTRSPRRWPPAAPGGEPPVTARARAAAPASHLPAPDQRRLRPVRGDRADCPTCTTWASTGSTSRRCWRPSRAAPTATTWSASTTWTSPGAVPRDWRRCRPRPAGSGWACWSTSCPTTSAWPRPPATRGGGTCSSTARTRVHAEAFDIDWEFGLGKMLVPVLGDDDVPVDGGPTGTSRSSTTSCATTTTGSPWLPAPSEARPTRCTAPALRAGQLAPR